MYFLFLPAPKVVQQAPAPDQFLISPITGEKIPADKIQEHMRIGESPDALDHTCFLVEQKYMIFDNI